jgi:ABC-type branched-subunit amino acid transport system ATPase component
MTVIENLMLGRLYAAGERSRAARRDCLELLERTGLADVADAQAGDLTLLRLKRLELARALAVRPRVLLLDEIGAGLVESELRELIELIQRLRGEVEAILVVEHILDVIVACADRVLVLDWGKTLTDGAPTEVLGDPQVAAVYLGTGGGAVSVRAREREEMPAAPEPLLALEGVAARYGSFHALHDVSFAVRTGEVVALLGANGAGKTTTARVISGMVAATAGEIRFRGERIDGRRPHDIAALGIAHCMEGRRIFADLTVEENLLLGGRGAPTPSERTRRLDGVYELFPMLQAKRSDSGASLSGGQQQMLAIGRVLMADPELVIFDEISLGLAPVAVDAVYEALDELSRRGLTMLLVEQNVGRALALAHGAYVLEKGVVALQGAPTEILEDPRLRALYVGEAKGGQ